MVLSTRRPWYILTNLRPWPVYPTKNNHWNPAESLHDHMRPSCALKTRLHTFHTLELGRLCSCVLRLPHTVVKTLHLGKLRTRTAGDTERQAVRNEAGSIRAQASQPNTSVCRRSVSVHVKSYTDVKWEEKCLQLLFCEQTLFTKELCCLYRTLLSFRRLQKIRQGLVLLQVCFTLTRINIRLYANKWALDFTKQPCSLTFTLR